MRRMLIACVALLLPAMAPAQSATQVAERAGFVGTILISQGHVVETRTSIGSAAPTGGAPVATDAVWRWASVTKQIVATLVMQEVAAGRVALDTPIARYLPKFRGPTAGQITVRQLLRHQSGLPNPSGDETAVPVYYTPSYKGDRSPLTGYCAGKPLTAPGGNWQYNNCDYIVAGALLEAVTGKSWDRLLRYRITAPLRLRSVSATRSLVATVPGYEDGKPEAPQDLASYGASAALSGTIDDLWRVDRALLSGQLLTPAARAELWDGQPALGFIALGQWVFTAPLKGCAKPVKLVERRGSIGGVEVRNFLLPEADRVVIAFSNRAPFEFGEVWQGKGFSHDLLAAAACAPGEK
ncbi:serine hydrolase domain-containing protein [Sphingomonas radiodurans]|uniref:serine hydrolase domain-containing protein n=1 Tax=Sphingomonas radiodurans TaxID=2890321 RepID=UPI001E57E47A|nr:serine hydrolase domain-containing protein [Sphingomonas radiodurans]WBH17918.1 serine hydrolase [Sphingomonas radiodurans]